MQGGANTLGKVSWTDRPIVAEAVWFAIGAFGLSCLSVFQKLLIGADPFVLRGYIVPVLFGGFSVLLIGVFFRRSRRNLIAKLGQQTAEAIRTRLDAQDQEVLAFIAHVALLPIPLEKMLHQSLGKLLTRHRFEFTAQGSIFLIDEGTGDLVMKAEQGLSEGLRTACARVKPGHCLCGRAAADGAIVFADGIDHRHETIVDGMEPHGHYCVPIQAEGTVLGVLNLYVPAGHVRNKAEDRFVTTVADTLAGVIRRVRAEEALRRTRDDLEIRVTERTKDLTHEIEGRKQVEESLRKLSRAVEQSSALVFITDRAGTIEYVNAMFTDLTGYTAEEAIGQNPRLLRSGDTPKDTYTDMWRTILKGETWRGDLKDRRKDGRIFWASASIFPIKDAEGAVTHFVAMHEDITQRKLAESEIQAAREAAEVANRAKAELLANTSHELRTPLNAIIGFSSALEDGVFGPLANEKQREYVSDIRNSGTHLLAMINDILDASALEAGALTLTEGELEVADLIGGSIRMVAPRATAGGIDLTTAFPPDLPRVRGDERRIKQVLLNLLSNAVKFTPEGGRIEVAAKLNGQGSMAITVDDTGIGMDRDGLAKAMTPFGQVDGGLARKHEGTGLGLPLSMGLVEAHGGTLVLTSEKGRGTTASILLPADRIL